MDLVAPIIPDGNKSRGPDLFLEGMRGGLAALTQFAQIRRQSESDIARMALQERLAQESHELDARKLDMAAEIMPLQKNLLIAQTERAKNSGKDTINFNLQQQAMVDDVDNQATKYKLKDEQFRIKHPVLYARAVDEFEAANRFNPYAKQAIAAFKSKTDEQSMVLNIGSTYDSGTKSWVGGSPKEVSVLQLYKNLSDPLKRDDTLRVLNANGLTKVLDAKEAEKISPSDNSMLPNQKTDRRHEWTDKAGSLKDYILTDPSVDFKAPLPDSRVPPAMLRKRDIRGTEGSPLEQADIPEDTTSDPVTDPQASNSDGSLFAPSKNELLMESAIKAIKLGAPLKAVAQRLAQNGIDPNQLFA